MSIHWKTLLSTGLLAIWGPAAFAQLNSNVSVQGEYAPLVIETERMNSFPQGYKFELPAANLEYEFTGIVSEFKPSLLTMGVTGRQTAWPWEKKDGFVDFRMGSWLDTRLHAGYNIISDNANCLNVILKYESSSLFRMKDVPEYFTKMPRKRLYDGRIGLNYAQLLGEDGMLTANAGYRASYFNYYGTTIERSSSNTFDRGFTVPSQMLNQVDASIGYSSSPSFIRGWHAGVSLDYLAYRSLYSPAAKGLESSGDRETTLNAEAGYALAAGESGAVSIDAKGNFIFYASKEPEALEIIDPKRRNYGVIDIKPSYRFLSQNVKLQAGLDLAFAFDAMGVSSEKKFGALHLAPDVILEYATKGFGLSIEAKGGVTPSTLSMREKFNRYQLPWALSTTPVYSPLDACIGFNVGPFSGFSASLGFRYAIARNTPLGGWYQSYLGAWLPKSFVPDLADLLNPYMQTLNLHGYSINLGLEYAYGNKVNVSFNGIYTPQKGETGIFNGYDRPRWILSANVQAKPIERLSLELGYDYRGGRKIYGWKDGTELASYRLSDITDLNAKVSYRLFDNFDIYCKGENLLNRNADLIPGLQSEGIVISGGFYWIF